MNRAIVTITNNGENVKYTLNKQEDDSWVFSDEGEIYDEDTMVVEVDVWTESNETHFNIQSDDEQLMYTLTNFILENQSYFGYRMIHYYPQVISVLTEYQGLINACGFEVDFLKCRFTFTYHDAFLTTMGDARCKEWERILGITPNANSTLSTRRNNVIATLISRFKLNTQSIADTVRTLTGNTCESWFDNSCIYIRIKPHDLQFQDDYPDVYAALIARVPAHLGLNIMRYYSSWRAVMENYYNWQEVKDQNSNWRTVKFKLYASDY